jgi:phosphoribosyl 1,2-cyclic phosphodiesterase
MRVKLWGVRGSTPTPERRNARYGGNTTCLEVRLDNGTLIILDCGSGLRSLGKSLLREFGEHPIRGFIFLTHFHWDHIQGIPFFAPLYRSSDHFLFHAVRRNEDELKRVIEGQMINPYFPVDMTVLASARNFYDLDYSAIEIQGAVIRSAPLNHPQECVAYRIEADGGAFVLATDTEPGSPVHDRALQELTEGADVLVYDAQYTPEQLQGERKGWGHSSWLEGTRIAKQCGVQHLILTHHDPDNDDIFVDGIVERARQAFPNVQGAAEGLEIDVCDRTAGLACPASTPRREPRYHLELPLRVIWRLENGDRAEARGMVRNLSKSGIYFLVPNHIRTNRPLELEMAVPEEITGQREALCRFAAQPIREQPVGSVLTGSAPCIGVAARRMDCEQAPWDREYFHQVV